MKWREAFKRGLHFAQGDAGSLKARVFRSGFWVSLSGVIASLLNFGRSIVLARLLTPETFGLMGLASIALRTIETFTRPGISQALIARQRDFDEASATAFTLLIGRGVLLGALLAAAAPWVALFYETDELKPVLQVLSLVLAIGGLANINTIARRKELDFRALSYLGLATALLSTIVTIAAAFWLRNVWALVIGQLASVTLTTLLSYHFIGGSPRMAFDWPIARELMTYGKFITGSTILAFVAAELDSAVVGKLVGMAELGLYVIAYTIANFATSNLSQIVSSVMMPAFSKLQSDIPAVKNVYLRSLMFIMFAVLPTTAGLMLVAEPLILVVYGEQWIEAALALQILVVFGLLRSIGSFNGYLFEGIGLPRIPFVINGLRLLTVAPLIVPMVLWEGRAGAAIAVTIGVAVHCLAGLLYLRKHISLSLTQLAVSLWRPVWTTLAMAASVGGLMAVIRSDTIAGLATVIVGGAAVYGGLNFRVLSALKKERLT